MNSNQTNRGLTHGPCLRSVWRFKKINWEPIYCTTFRHPSTSWLFTALYMEKSARDISSRFATTRGIYRCLGLRHTQVMKVGRLKSEIKSFHLRFSLAPLAFMPFWCVICPKNMGTISGWISILVPCDSHGNSYFLVVFTFSAGGLGQWHLKDGSFPSSEKQATKSFLISRLFTWIGPNSTKNPTHVTGVVRQSLMG